MVSVLYLLVPVRLREIIHHRQLAMNSRSDSAEKDGLVPRLRLQRMFGPLRQNHRPWWTLSLGVGLHDDAGDVASMAFCSSLSSLSLLGEEKYVFLYIG